MDIKPVRIRCRCNTCGKRFAIMSSIGRSDICDDCADILLEIIFGKRFRDICVLRRKA